MRHMLPTLLTLTIALTPSASSAQTPPSTPSSSSSKTTKTDDCEAVRKKNDALVKEANKCTALALKRAGALDESRREHRKKDVVIAGLRVQNEERAVELALRPPPARVAGATMMASCGAGVAVALVRLGMTGELDVGLVVLSGVQCVGGGLVFWWGGE